ncbi:MAG: septum formation initiator family protein [Candidatus Pacebacteria bacterium]|nr:septum formation initiator family protein [Candidatus Paceibacterota bacterium]
MKNKKKQITLNTILTCLILLLIVVFLFLNNLRIYRKRAELSSIIGQLEDKKKELEDKKKELEEKIDGIYTQEYLERIAREQLSLVKPGEQVVVIQELEQEEEEEEKKTSFWDFKWLFK